MKRARGFTLVELAIAVAVIALLLSMLIVPLSAQIDQQRVSDTRKTLDLITEAILGFAVANGRLPCPATANVPNTTAGAGTEVRTPMPTPTMCATSEGVIPWATLGLPETDAWGRRFTYRVTLSFADNPAGGLQSTFTLTDGGDITVTSGGAAPVTLASGIPAVVVSHGKNGLGGFMPDGMAAPGAAAGDELQNANNNTTFVAKIPEPTFDDIVVWISPNVLKSRMVAANRLP